jgi:hypothetical protein
MTLFEVRAGHSGRGVVFFAARRSMACHGRFFDGGNHAASFELVHRSRQS